MKKKFYQSRNMLRAGRPQHVIRLPFTAVHLLPGGSVKVIATTNITALCRDHAGWPKDFARSVAGIHPMRLAIYQCTAEQGEDIARMMTRPTPTTQLPVGFALFPQ